MTRLAALILVLWALGAAPALARAQGAAFDIPLITDLSAHLIAITSSFTGTELLLFGSLEEAGDVIGVLHNIYCDAARAGASVNPAPMAARG